MARYKFQPGTFTDGLGRIVVGGTATVYLAGTTTLATIYAAESGGSAITGSVLTTDSAGVFEFWVDSVDYPFGQKFKITLAATGFSTQTYDDIEIIKIYNSVKEFGAVGDNVNDDSSAIQAAIDAFENGDGTVYFPPGFYKCNSPITVYRGTRLMGDRQRQGGGTSIYSGPARLSFSNDTDGIITPVGWTPTGGVDERSHGVVIEHLTIAGTSRTNGTNGILLRDNTGGAGTIHPGVFRMQNVSVWNFEIGVNLSGMADTTWINQCDIGFNRIGIIGGHTDDYVNNTFFWDITGTLIDTSCNRGIYTNLELADLSGEGRATGINVRTGTGDERGVGEHCIIDGNQAGNTLKNPIIINGVVGAKITNNALHGLLNAIIVKGAATDFVCTGNSTKTHGSTVGGASSNEPAIHITGSSLRGVVKNNAIIAGSTWGKIGVQIDSGCTDIEVDSNTVDSTITIPLTDNGTGTKIARKSVDRTTALVEVVNTATDTTLYSFSVGADFLWIDRTLRLVVFLDYLNNSGGASDVTFRAKFGASATILATAALSRPSDANRSPVECQYDLFARGAASETISGRVRFGDQNTVGGTMGSLDHELFGANTAVTEDLTTASTFTFTVQHGTAHANISCRLLAAYLELI